MINERFISATRITCTVRPAKEQKEVFAFQQVAERDHNIISSSAASPVLQKNVEKCKELFARRE